MKKLRRSFNRFCYRNRNKGIPNLMLYVTLGTGIVYFIRMMDPSNMLFYWLYFDPDLILQGQVWRLITYPLTHSSSTALWTVLMLMCYYSLGRGIENIWGTFRFNLYYFTGILLTDVFCLIFGGYADAYYLNLTLLLAYATLYPNAQFTLFLIIPIKAWVLALIDLFFLAEGLRYQFPWNILPVIAVSNYFLFFGKDWLNLFPDSWRINASRTTKKAAHPRSKTIPFNPAGSYQATHAKPQAPYTHKCTVCGRTDVDFPDLEFRYCSRCKGYHCYCSEHISNHAHITE